MLHWAPMWFVLVAGLLSLPLAAVLYGQRPGFGQNRAAAVFLWSSGLGWAMWAGPAALGGTDPFPVSVYLASGHAAYVAWTLALWGYLWLLGTLEAPVGWFLRRPTVRAFVSLVALVALWSIPFSSWRRGASAADATLTFDLVWIAIMALGVVAAVQAWRRSPAGLLRRKNAAFALAFVTHDALMLVFFVTGYLSFLEPLRFLAFLGVWAILMPALAIFALQFFIVYGMLSTQLFDFHVKLRAGIGRGFVGALFLATFFAVSEIVSGWLSDRIGLFLGVGATALLVLVLAPLQRVADHVAARAVPGPVDSPAFLARRKEEVYRAQLEELMADDVVTIKERRALLRLQETLELDGNLAARLEREVLERRGLSM